MRFSRIVFAAVLLCLAANGVAQATVSSGAPPRASLTQPGCVTALDPSARSVNVTAVMRPVSDTAVLSVKFELLQKLPGGVYTQLSAPGLGSWLSPTDPPTLGQRPGDVWYVQHPVADLPAPAHYRFRVIFRWLGAKGKVLQHSSLLEAPCWQPELRPNLVVKSVTVKPGDHPRVMNSYFATIADTGATGAGPFTVQLSAGGQIVETTVPQIAAHSRLTVKLVGPVCSSNPPTTVTVDPRDQVNVYSRAQAMTTVACPAPSATPATTTRA